MHARPDPYLAPAIAHVAREGLGHRHEIDDPGLADPQRGDACGVRLDFAQRVEDQDLETLEAVLASALEQIAEPGKLGRRGGDQDFATRFVRYPPVLAVAHELRTALHAVARLGRSGLVVQAGVDHPAVVTGLMRGDPRLGLDHDDRSVHDRRQGPCSRQTHDPAADDRDLECGHRASPRRSLPGANAGPSDRG